MTNELSTALQQKDQNIVNAMGLIVTVKDRLQHLRDNGWDAFLKEVEMFCSEKSILVSRMEDTIPIRGRSSLAVKMVATRKHVILPLVYRFIELALILPMATTSVERAFSAMNIVKTELRNKMGDEWLNDLMVWCIEREIFADIDDEVILQHFQNMQTRRFQLAPRSRSNSGRN
ncbi:UNVERIFIED_CONTAM: hypothetical protein Scaly_0588800 [Sesamum calycinum]|uniref:HAT C-terminal dimerisation domain-containing protein n=1 Tax=Sesamum calycinum TaxID=2727403 RepID=A0AAW2RS06_9LAMI